jgi:hypothetical protein
VARHYGKLRPQPVTHIQILNEPLYTREALPQELGYTLADYLHMLDMAARAVHAANPRCQVIGGISAGVADNLTREFVLNGGLRLVDVFDLHMYDPVRTTKQLEESFNSLETLMRTNGGPKEVWISELGCYADDDPACIPQSTGDPTMDQCWWGSERAAAEQFVKFTAIAFAHGVRKIFFHAGVSGTINESDAGGVLFEYGGTPRKMYPAIASLDRLLGTPDECLDRICDRGLMAYVFRVGNRTVAIAWCADEKTRKLTLTGDIEVYDVMGNKLAQRSPLLGQSPLYVRGKRVESILRALAR